MLILSISSCALFFSIALIAIGLRDVNKYSWQLPVGGLCGIASLLLGFGLAGCIVPVEKKYSPVEKFSYAKTKSTIIIETPKITSTYNDALTYNTINDSTKLLYLIEYNSYGWELNRTIIINSK